MTLSYQYLSVNLTILDNLGFPKARALDVLGIDESNLVASDARLSLEAFQACLSEAAKFTSDSNIGLRLGHKFRVGAFGQTGGLYSYCENLEEVIRMNNLYQKIAIDAGKVEYLQKSDGSHHMCFRPHYSDFWGSGEDILCARLPYVPENDIQSYSDILQTKLKRDIDDICVQFSDVAMSQKLTTHNPEHLARTRITLDKLLGNQTDGYAFETAVEAAIRGAMESGTVSSYVVAERMGLSASALRAKLAVTDEGIAMDLAYNDQAAMNRAFRRWFGMTPSQWRSEIE